MADSQTAETELPIRSHQNRNKEDVMSLRNGKAAGPDEIPTEAIKGVWGLQ